MSHRTKTEQQQIDFLAGQVSALGLACFALLKTHPNRAAAVQVLNDALERQLAAMLPSPLSDEVRSGIEAARDLFLLKSPPDPGQPTRL